MSAAKELGNEPAYPWGEHGAALGGVTKRELFAAMAMQGLLANPSVLEREASRQEWLAPGYDETAIQERAIAHADALLAVLKGGAA